MEKRAVNPTPWMQHFGMNHGVEVKGHTRTLYLSGQVSADAEGHVVNAGDLVAQFQLAWDNLKAALDEADVAPTDVVRLNIFTTDMDGFMEKSEDLVAVFAADGTQPVCTLLGVAALFDPAAMVELEATAVA